MSEAKIPGGFILISRKIVESEIWDKPPLYIKIWLWLLQAAQHSPYKGLKRGQLHCSIEDIQEGVSWHIGYRKELPSKDQVFQVLDWMRNGTGKNLRKRYESNDGSNRDNDMIATARATRGILVNIVNYGLYQNPSNYESNSESNEIDNTKATTKPLRYQHDKQECKIYSSSKVFDSESEPYRLAKKMLEFIQGNKPDFKIPDLQKWAKDFDLMIRIDKREALRIFKVMEFSQKDSFWRTNILSPGKLRKQFDQLEMKMTDKPKQSGLGWL